MTELYLLSNPLFIICLEIRPVISAIEKTYVEVRIGIDASMLSVSKIYAAMRIDIPLGLHLF
jgi:hypothetical protein